MSKCGKFEYAGHVRLVISHQQHVSQNKGKYHDPNTVKKKHSYPKQTKISVCPTLLYMFYNSAQWYVDYENEMIWGKFQKDCTPNTRKTEGIYKS